MLVVAHNGARIWGGAERATVSLLSGLQSRGHRVLLLCNESIVASHARRLGVETANCQIGGDIALPHAFRLAGMLRKLRPDAFIIGTYKKLALAGLGARKARVHRVIARVGLESDTPRSAKYRFALKHWVDGVVVNSQSIASSFESLPGFDARKVKVIYNGVKLPTTFKPGSVRAALGISPDAPVIGTVARLVIQKRIDRLIEAMTLLPPEVHCIIAGEGALRRALEDRRNALGLAGRVHLLGHRDDVGDVLAAMDLFVVASDTEGMSNAMLEAMAVGLPVISTRVSGAAEALIEPGGDESAGVIVDFSPEGLADAASGLLPDLVTRRRMQEIGRARATRNFSIERMLDDWERFL